MLFIARGNEITASGRDLSSSAYIMGDQEISFVQLELPPSIAVELDEEVLPPISAPGDGIFSIDQMNVYAAVQTPQGVENLNEDIIAPGLTDSALLQIDDLTLHANISNNSEIQNLDEIEPQAFDLNLAISEINSTTILFNDTQDELTSLVLPNPPLNQINIDSLVTQTTISSPELENLSGIESSFSVLNISSLNTTTIIKNTSNTDNLTSSFPHPNYIL